MQCYIVHCRSEINSRLSPLECLRDAVEGQGREQLRDNRQPRVLHGQAGRERVAALGNVPDRDY